MDLQGTQSNSWKWSNLAWNSSSSLTIYFSILPTLWSAIASSRNTLVLTPTLGNWNNPRACQLIHRWTCEHTGTKITITIKTL